MLTKTWLTARYEEDCVVRVSVMSSAEYDPGRSATEEVIVPESELEMIVTEFARLVELYRAKSEKRATASAFEALKIAERRGEVLA